MVVGVALNLLESISSDSNSFVVEFRPMKPIEISFVSHCLLPHRMKRKKYDGMPNRDHYEESQYHRLQAAQYQWDLLDLNDSIVVIGGS